MNRPIAGLVVGLVCAMPGPVAAQAAEPAGKLVKPCVVISGADSHVAERRYHRITSADEWTRVWQEHKGQTVTGQYDLFYDPLTLPSIDFDRYMVIGIFEGKSWNNAGLMAVSISEGADRIVFRFTDKGYQTAGPGGGGKKVAVYGFFVVPRSTKPVVLEQLMQSRRVGPDVWKECITFPKL